MPEFPVTRDAWDKYLHGLHYAAPRDAADRPRPVVNILLTAWQTALVQWPDASEEDRLRWVCLVMQYSINEQAAYLMRLVENQPFPPILVTT